MEFDASLSYLRVEIDKKTNGRLPVPQGFLDDHVRNASEIRTLLSEDLKVRLVRHLETIYGTQHGTGHVLKTDFQEWYPSRKADVESYYWRRLNKYWVDYSVLPVQVVKSIDKVTDEILGYLGDPQEEASWRRSGLVMGHVQSGKTTNYSALIAKAADAGYRIIIVLSGLTSSLRYQTQVRLDKAFVGKSSLGDKLVSEIYPVSNVLKGTDYEGLKQRQPFCGTTQSGDFSVNIIRGITAEEGNFAGPILFVTKKHEKVLESLASWLSDLKPGSPLDGPMLLIDDEADNASVNTSKDPKKTTRINSRIRELLRCSRRTSYVGYTATPFANIFIDPDTEDEMLNSDLFPEHFIKSLEPPENYVGAEKLFSEKAEYFESCVREIPPDYTDYLPLKHKSGDLVSELPQSLKDAMCQYVIARAIRVLDGEGHKHSSMLVNVSRFNAIQKQVHDLLYVLLQDVSAAVSAWSSSAAWATSPIMLKLHNVWLAEFSSQADYGWDDIRGALRRGVAPVEVKLVNMKGGGLDYNSPPASGIHVIAVGGLALARGLTLEGLIISYVLRNVGAADTLLQMGRWFGYRDGYANICRIHATEEMLGDFREVSGAVEELRNDLVRMERMKVTPNEFGLKVRQSPTGIAITAANKMRGAKSVVMAVDLSLKHLQAYELFNDRDINRKHFSVVSSLVGILESEYKENKGSDGGALVWKGINVSVIQEMLLKFELPQIEFAIGSGERSLVLDYISDRASGELSRWDVAIPFRRTGEPKLEFPFCMEAEGNVYCRRRKSGVPKSDDPDVVKVTANHVVADSAEFDLPYGEKERLSELLPMLEKEYPSASPELRHLMARTRPLLIIHLMDFELKKRQGGDSGKSLNFDEGSPVVSISLAFPGTKVDASAREYYATKRLTEMMERQREELESDEDLDSDE